MRRTRCLLPLAICVLAPLTALAQWEPEVRLTDNSSESVTSFDNARCVAAAGATIHVVWHDDRDGNTEIYYKRSTDNGTTWGADTRLTTDASWSERPSVAVRDSVIHVVWYDGRIGPPRIFYKHSLDNGTTWGPDVCLTPTAGVGYHPSVAVCGFDRSCRVDRHERRASDLLYAFSGQRHDLGSGEEYHAGRSAGRQEPRIDRGCWFDRPCDMDGHAERSSDLLHALARFWRDLGDGQEYYAGAVAVCLGSGFRFHRPCRVCGFPLWRLPRSITRARLTMA